MLLFCRKANHVLTTWKVKRKLSSWLRWGGGTASHPLATNRCFLVHFVFPSLLVRWWWGVGEREVGRNLTLLIGPAFHLCHEEEGCLLDFYFKRWYRYLDYKHRGQTLFQKKFPPVLFYFLKERVVQGLMAHFRYKVKTEIDVKFNETTPKVLRCVCNDL